ncbi:MAG: DNA translocase FtsK [Treponema sp.]|jgi:S-DNA-T family DNA segregation ATPase FtsK/SpoIIIE|nr:DNA translocase FtsK [Treponema sp.]
MDNKNVEYKFRVISAFMAVFLVICGILMIFFLLASLFGFKYFPPEPGRLFANSFGILSLLIPLYLFYAAFILAAKWRPERIYILNAGIFPFITLVAGFALIRGFDILSARYAFFKLTGKTGFSLLIIFITVAETLFLQYIKGLLFNNADRKEPVRHRSTKLLPAPKIPPAEPQNSAALTLRNVSHKPELPPVKPVEPVELDEGIDAEQKCDQVLDKIMSGEIIDPDIKDMEMPGDGEIDEEIPNGDPEFTHVFEEAEVAAALYGEEQKQKKASKTQRSKKYKVPVDILNEYPDGEYWLIDQATRDSAIALKETLKEFKIQAEVTGIRKGPVITMFEILPAPGVKLSKIVGLADNIALRLAASSVRIVAPIPGKHAVGIEVPNERRNIVSFREIIEGEMQRSDRHMEIPLVMGKDITGEAQTIDLVQMPHLLIAGATGSGKSVCVNSMILSILYQLHPSDCRLILIDPKIVELKLYNDIPHLLTPVITEPKKAFQALQYCIYEMERRYACLDNMGVRDIRSYNRRVKEKNAAQEQMPYIVVVIDEFADLMTTTGKELESTVARLAAMSRAVGIHLVLATQRPSIDVITGLIKANIPSRIAFMVASKTDSRIIIDMTGAEKLLGKGDMLYAGAVDPFPVRMQGAFISEEEVEAVVAHVKSFGSPDYIDDEIFFEEEDDPGASLFTDGDDPLYEKALEIVMQQGKASASFIQRRLKIGFNRAARLVDEMEHNGVVGPANGSKPRELMRGM